MKSVEFKFLKVKEL